jgi:hypothetical protein
VNALEKFEKKKWPEDIQYNIERFAGHDGEYTEKDYGYWFRAGFLTREFSSHEGFIMVRKEDINLGWYKRVKAEISGGRGMRAVDEAKEGGHT